MSDSGEIQEIDVEMAEGEDGGNTPTSDLQEQDTASNPPAVDDADEDAEDEDGLNPRHSINDESVVDEEESAVGNDERTENASPGEDDEDDLTVKSEIADDDESVASKAKEDASSVSPSMKSSKKRPSPAKGGSIIKKGRAPSVSGLTIPFRTVKKAMKLDPDIPIVQNEAAIMTTVATEAFLRSLARKSHRNAKNRGRNTIRYEDVAEARAQDPALSFLEPLLP